MKIGVHIIVLGEKMRIDFNQLEAVADYMMSNAHYESAAEIYYFMANGDSSLDAGYLGHKIGLCYEKRGKLIAAKYWYGRAVEENPEIVLYRDAQARLNDVTIPDSLIRTF